MEIHRDAAGAAIRALGHELIRAEDFGASPQSPQQACLAGVRAADVVVLLLGTRYGFIQGSGLSATHEEYREAKQRCDVLVFIEHGVERESEQDALVTEAQDWSAGQYTEPFTSTQSLRDVVTRRLHELELARQAGRPDDAEMLARAEMLVPSPRDAYRDSLVVVVAGGPRQQVLRPAEIESEDLRRRIMQEALFGRDAVFTPEEATRGEVAGHTLRLFQDRAALSLDDQGSISIVQPAAAQPEPTIISALIEEEILDRLERALRFTGWLLDQLDGPRRLTDIVPVACLLNAGYMPWRTKADQERSPNSAVMSRGTDSIVVHVSPASRKRAALINNSREIAEDLMVLLRRELKPH